MREERRMFLRRHSRAGAICVIMGVKNKTGRLAAGEAIELTEEEKLAVSHRGCALRSFAKLFKELKENSDE